MDVDRALAERPGIVTFGVALTVLAVCSIGVATVFLTVLGITTPIGLLGSSAGGPDHDARTIACAAADVELIAAAYRGKRDVVVRELEQGTSPDVRDAYDNSPLACAARADDEHIVELLLAAGANPNGTGPGGDPLLFTALDRCSVAVAEQLLDAGADLGGTDRRGRTPLDVARIFGDVQMLTMLLDRGASAPDAGMFDPREDAREASIRLGCGDVGIHPARAVLDGLDGGEEPDTHLVEAVRLGLPWLVQEALDAGADPETRQSIMQASLEMWAAPNLPHYFALLERADVDNPAPPMPELIEWDGEQPEIRGLEDGEPIVIPVLLQAAWSGDERIVRVLLEAGADPNVASTGGYTALHAAATNGCVDCTTVLLDAGAVEPEGIISPDELAEQRQWASLDLFAGLESVDPVTSTP